MTSRYRLFVVNLATRYDTCYKSSIEKIGKIILVGKNVCHNKKNTRSEIWNHKEYNYLLINIRLKSKNVYMIY